ncbi:MAG: hypothetical protein OEZ22_08360 [Spirochaetia bacterium]|nr:hypothetical protein [Spirochaetia bacterium]
MLKNKKILKIKRKLLSIITIAFFLINGSSIFAGLASTNYNYINDLIGDRATGLGGAFSAISDDPSGAYYNPAGLAFAFDNQISLSVNTYKNKKMIYEEAIFKQKNYNQHIESLYPSFFGVIQSIGPLKIAITFININNEILDQDDSNKNLVVVEDDGSKYNIDYHINYNNTDNTAMAGLSTGFFILDNLTAGISFFGIRRRQEQIQNEIFKYIEGPSGAYPDESYSIQNYYQTDISYGISGRFGIQWMPVTSFSVGLNAGGGLIPYYKKSSQVAEPSAVILVNRFKKPEEPSEEDAGLPVDVRFGVAFFASKQFLVTAEAIAHFGTLYFNTTVKNTINGAIGMEYYLTDATPFSLGFFTNFANTPEIVKEKIKQDMHADLFGISTGISLQTRNSSINLSGFYQFGNGEAKITEIGTLIQKVKIQMFQIGLTGSAKY